MLQGAWLLTDLDGTLISTPHKACGRYLSLNESPCLHAIKRWLLNGGSICIVTTADKRVFDQVYAPLKSILRNNAGSGNCGELLLSLYTGALLYRCTASGVEVCREYAEATHCAPSDMAELTKVHSSQLKHGSLKKVGDDMSTRQRGLYVEGTCFSLDIYYALLGRIEDIFFTFLVEMLSEESNVTDAFKGMSARYKKMWKVLFTYLHVRYMRDGKQHTVSTVAAIEWKRNFLQQRRQLLRELGIIRAEIVGSDNMWTMKQFDTDAKEKNARHVEEQVLSTLEDDSEASCTFARTMTRLLNAKPIDNTTNVDNDSNTYHYGNQIKRRCGVVAQVIVLGIPSQLFLRYFERHLRGFAELGVTAIPQPNSVIFTKMGISKSTVIRYLMDQREQPSQEECCDVHHLYQQKTRNLLRLRGIVDITKSVALGDNPHTADYGLTVFPQLPFVSVEMAEQRQRRHACIHNATTTTGLQRGLLMDDRCVRNLHYVGGEEIGTSLFLSYLMNTLHVPSTGTLKGKDMPFANSKLFSSAVAYSAARAFSEVSGTHSQL